MDLEPSSQNQNQGFFQKNQTYIIAAVLIVLAIILFVVNRGGDKNDQNDDGQVTEQTSDMAASDSAMDDKAMDENKPQDQAATNNQQNNAAESAAPKTNGNVTAGGVLKESNNSAKGNLMIDGSAGKIYISTVRDFSSLLNKEVKLDAQGTINDFVFLGLAEAGKTSGTAGTTGTAGTDSTMSPGTNVKFSGTLQQSDSATKGNYIIFSGNNKVYLKTSQNHSAWLGSEVNLMASGTLDSFTNASLAKK